MALDGASAEDEKKDDEDESGSDSDKEVEETKMVVRTERKTGKKSSKRTKLYSESYMTMCRTPGMSAPVYGECAEATPMEILDEKEELALLTMVTLCSHLPRPNNGEKVVKNLQNMNVQPEVGKGIKKDFMFYGNGAKTKVEQAKGEPAVPTCKHGAGDDRCTTQQH